jgi:hypothetical protein
MDRNEPGRFPWRGERICLSCWQPRLGLNDEGLCEACARKSDEQQNAIDWMSDQIQKIAREKRDVPSAGTRGPGSGASDA